MTDKHQTYPEYKNSDVEWLGKIPEHWIATSLKYIAKIRYGIGEPPKYRKKGVALIRATNVCSGRISNKDIVFVDPNDIPTNRVIWLKKGEIIIVRSGAGTGDSSIISEEYEGSIAGFDMVVTPVKCLPPFLGHALLSTYIRKNQIDLVKTRAAQPHLNSEELGKCFFLLPPMAEQVEISNFIDHETAKIDTLIEKQQLLIKLLKEKRQIVEFISRLSRQFDQLKKKTDCQIKLLKERRTVMISAAVTGKVDLRNWKNGI